MLRQSGLLNVESAPEADLKLRRSPLIDLYLESFVAEVERLRHAGLVKKYRLSEGNLHKLKGRILFPQHIRRNLLHRERIYTAHQTYDADNIYNRILKRALIVTENLALRPTITARAEALGLAFANVSEAQITADTFDRLRLDRNTQRYHRSLELARLIILNYSPDLQGGSNNVLAILFDMNKLFERFILVHLRRAQSEFKNGKLSITGQASERFWKSKTIRPDVVIDFHTLANAERIILDTKWKIPKDDQPSDDDLKQMYVYNLQFGARRSFLVYPRADDKQKETFAAYEKPVSVSPNHSHSCGTHFVDLFDANLDLRKDIGKQLLEQIINTVEQVGAN